MLSLYCLAFFTSLTPATLRAEVQNKTPALEGQAITDDRAVDQTFLNKFCGCAANNRKISAVTADITGADPKARSVICPFTVFNDRSHTA